MSTMDSAAGQVLAGIDQLLATQDNDLIIPYTRVNDAVTQLVEGNAGTVVKMVDKILRSAAKHLNKVDDALDGVQTRVLMGLEQYLQDAELLLQQLTVKGGLTQPGQALEQALETEAASAGQLTYQGTLVLLASEMRPLFEALVYVLGEIRDRMPPTPSIAAKELKGEEPGWESFAQPGDPNAGGGRPDPD